MKVYLLKNKTVSDLRFTVDRTVEPPVRTALLQTFLSYAELTPYGEEARPGSFFHKAIRFYDPTEPSLLSYRFEMSPSNPDILRVILSGAMLQKFCALGKPCLALQLTLGEGMEGAHGREEIPKRRRTAVTVTSDYARLLPDGSCRVELHLPETLWPITPRWDTPFVLAWFDLSVILAESQFDPGHETRLMMQRMLQEGKDMDVQLISRELTITRCHSSVVAAQCGILNGARRSSSGQSKIKVVHLRDLSCAAVQSLVSFLYYREFVMPESVALLTELLQAGEKHEWQDLKDRVKDLLMEQPLEAWNDVDAVLRLYLYVKRFPALGPIKKKCIQLFTRKRVDVMMSPLYMSLFNNLGFNKDGIELTNHLLFYAKF